MWNLKYGLLFLSDGEIIQTENGKIKYDEISRIGSGLVGARLNDKWGVINNIGDIAIPFIYDSAFGFTDGLAGVKINNKFGNIIQLYTKLL